MGFLRTYGPRLGVFALIVGVFAGILALHLNSRNREAADVGLRLDRALALPEDELDKRITELRGILKDSPGCEAEPWVSLALGDQLFRRAQASKADEARRFAEEAYAVFSAIPRKTPAHAAAPLALFSAGCAAEELGKPAEALRLYNELQDNYGQSYLVSGGDKSLRESHVQGLTERVQKYREAFPSGS